MKKSLAEFIGTFWLVFGGCGSALLAAGFPNVGIGLLGVSLAFGLTVVTMAYALGPVSGAHLNPAVTIGLWIGGRIPSKEVLPYILSQIAGGIVAATALYFIVTGNGTEIGSFAANGYGEHSPGNYSMQAAIITEFIMTFMFLLIILGATDDRAPKGFAGLAIGLTLTLIHLVNIPVTIKHRLGIDELDSQEYLLGFIDQVRQSGCSTFIVHARKAILQGLNPKQNREIPPLCYDRVYEVKQVFPDLEIIINGGITSMDACITHLQHVDGVMIGREAYQNPYPLLSQVDALLFDDHHPVASRQAIAEAFIPYIEAQVALGAPLYAITKHLLGLFHGQRGGKQFRRHISENGHKQAAGPEVFIQALEFVTG